MRNTRRRRNRRNQRRWRLVEWCFWVAFAVVLILLVNKMVSQKKISNEEQSAAQDALLAAQTSPQASSEPAILPEMQSLLDQNADFVGLLTFGDDFSRYVCQADDNIYYMSHAFDQSENDAGMVFMDCENSILPRSQNLILYGHNMKDGSRFGELHHYEDVDYLLQYPTFTFSTLYETHSYTPFAVFITTTDTASDQYFDFAVTDFADEDAFNAYVNAVVERSEYYIPAAVTYGTNLLTLVTCDSDLEHGRLVIVLRETA